MTISILAALAVLFGAVLLSSRMNSRPQTARIPVRIRAPRSKRF